jgi:hypothetical protein
LDNATFEDKKRYIDLLGVWGTLALEDGKEIIYIKCKLGKQRLVLAVTSLSRNDRKDNRITITARLVIGCRTKR